ncbi:MAG: alanine--tRNA ligase [Phycisphaerales bacterium JB054]
MPKPTTAQIRQTFIDYFVGRHAHRFVPSSPVIPHDDPTLLFANAGMNQFKPAFLGQVAPDSPLAGVTRAVNTQKCIRAGGKHNDLEDVGKDTYHHTFFEMLGNWSFGDFFKEEIIEWAWDLLTNVYKLPGERLYATYFGGDEASGLKPDTEARDLWRRFLPADRVLPGNMKDNFWEMGDTGPCGPCSELHFDRIGGRDAAALVNADDPNVIEIWNLVFIQYDRQQGGALKNLPAQHVDTGMGLERLASIIQGVTSNYDTDLFTPIFAAIENITHDPRGYHGKLGKDDPDGHDMAYRVIADHVRTLTFAITDGAVPSNEGRGYVLRRILRRAVRFGRQKLNAPPGFFSQLVPVVVEHMSGAFPELKKNPERVIEVIRDEEESFGKTLDRGIDHFNGAVVHTLNDLPLIAEAPPGMIRVQEIRKDERGWYYSTGWMHLDAGQPTHHLTVYADEFSLESVRRHFSRDPVFEGDQAFKLYDTYGFPLDLTVLMAEERGLAVDVDGFEKCMAEQKERSRGAQSTGSGETETLDAEALARLKRLNVKPTDDGNKFNARDLRATVKAIWSGHNFEEHATATSNVARRIGLIFDKTNHYAEMGGQVTDHGRALVSRERNVGGHNHGGEFKIEDVRTFGGYAVHFGRVVRGEIRVGDDVQLHIENQRRGQVASNHTATHLLNLGLRRVLGEGVEQKGSLVETDRLRFDFSHNKPVSPDELGLVEQIVAERIEQDLEVFADLAPLYVAKGINGLRAVFGETYPDPVRVVSVGVPIQTLLDDPDNAKWADYSIEFCGGTHVGRTSEAKAFALISETGIAKGIRRVEALTGVPAIAAHAAADDAEQRLDAAATLDATDLAGEASAIAAELDQLALPVARKAALRARLAALQDRVKEAAKEAARAKAAEAATLARQIAANHASSSEPVIVAELDTGGDRAALQAAMKTIQSSCPGKAVLLASVDPDGEKPGVALLAAVPPELVKLGLKAGDWIRETATVLGGKGGGRPEQAQGGGPEIDKLGEALRTARTVGMAGLSN